MLYYNTNNANYPCLKSQTQFSFLHMYLYDQLSLFYSAYVTVHIQLHCRPAISSLASCNPPRHDSLHATCCLSLAHAVTVLTCVKLLSRILLFTILPLDSTMESKRKCNSDNEGRKSCDVMTLAEKTEVLYKLRSDISAVAVGRTSR